MMRLQEIAALLNTTCTQDAELSSISIDSRQVQPRSLFVAIKGERFDGHDFIAEAVSRGAIAVLCEKEIPHMQAVQFVIPDALHALALIAAQHRQKHACNVIALTGSNGKTTVKEMIAAILPQPSHATRGNLNNHIGVPLSVLHLKPEHRYAVFELGANHPGEIAHSVAIVKPQVTLINNIAPAHVEGFGSIDGVAKAKGEIHQGLPKDGTAIINADDAYAHFWDDCLQGKKKVQFSAAKSTDIHARDIIFDEKGHAQFVLVTPAAEAQISLRVPGYHNVCNALAAAACTWALGIDTVRIASSLSEFAGVAGRMTPRIGKNQSLVLDDTYNANLRSVLAALEVLAKYKGKRIFVFGDMGELGEWARQHHEEVGEAARQHGIDMLMTCGAHSQFTAHAYGARGKHYPSQAALIQDLLPCLDEETIVLVKGSRSAAMENIVQQLIN